MRNKFLHKLSDLTNIHRRAAFTHITGSISDQESTFLSITRKRYSCRAFKDTPLTETQISHILEAARHAPSARNQQPVHVWVVKSPEALAKLRNATDYTYGAPVVFMVGCKPDEAWVRKYDGKNGAEVDAAIAGTHIMLEASALGLGNVWVGSFDPAKIREDFPETAGYEIVCLFPVGVPATDTSANHDKRKTMKEFASTL